VDAAVAAAVSLFRNAAGRKMSDIAMEHRAQSGRLKTALILASIALAFFISVFIRHWLW
jgi:hypothetical protein